MRQAYTFLLLALCSSLTFAQGSSTGVGILKIPTNALSASAGATAVTMPHAISAASVNPASMLLPDDRLSVSFTHTSWIEGSSANHLSVSLPTPIGRVLLTTGMNTVPDIEVRTQPGPASSTFSARTAVIGGGWGTTITEGILFALSASYVYDRLYDVEATGLSGGLGILATGLIDGATFGVSAMEIGTVSGYKGSTSDLPTRITVGGSYVLSLGEFTVRPAVSYQSVRLGASGVHVGAAVQYAFLTIRGTVRTGETAQTGSIGASVSYGGMSVDYALVPFSFGFGSGHLLSIGIDL